MTGPRSLNEIEALARKAARGAGLGWGLAEEASHTTRWLCAMGLPGGECLAALLETLDGTDPAAFRPDPVQGRWRAPGGTLCPLATGAALSDRAAQLAAGPRVTLGRTRFPLLLFPAIAGAADATGAALSLCWPGASLTRAGGESLVEPADPARLGAARVDSAEIGPAGAAGGTALPRAWRGRISPGAERALQHLAQRTYAPESEQSRLGGAGAGLTDND